MHKYAAMMSLDAYDPLPKLGEKSVVSKPPTPEEEKLYRERMFELRDCTDVGVRHYVYGYGGISNINAHAEDYLLQMERKHALNNHFGKFASPVNGQLYDVKVDESILGFSRAQLRKMAEALGIPREVLESEAGSTFEGLNQTPAAQSRTTTFTVKGFDEDTLIRTYEKMAQHDAEFYPHTVDMSAIGDGVKRTVVGKVTSDAPPAYQSVCEFADTRLNQTPAQPTTFDAFTAAVNTEHKRLGTCAVREVLREHGFIKLMEAANSPERWPSILAALRAL